VYVNWNNSTSKGSTFTPRHYLYEIIHISKVRKKSEISKQQAIIVAKARTSHTSTKPS